MWLVRVPDKGSEGLFKVEAQEPCVWRWKPKYMDGGSWKHKNGAVGGWSAIAPSVSRALSMIADAQIEHGDTHG